MIEWLEQYWAYIVAFIVIAIVTLFIMAKAASAYSSHQKSFKAQHDEITRLIKLKEKYIELNEEIIQAAPDEELLEGVALSYQLKLQKSDDSENDFEKLSLEKQYIYTLDVFVQDKSAKTFFAENGAVLKQKIIPALELIEESSFANKLKYISDMFDDENDSVSLDYKAIDEIDDYIEKYDIMQSIKISGAKYIQKNAEKFTS